jgi:hypothetical protein
MNKNLSALLAAIVLSAMAWPVSAQVVSTDPTITVQATLAPNAYGSPSWTQWTLNGLYAAQFNLGSYGAAGPTQYNVVTGPLPTADNIVTGYPSWLGQADPTGAYAGEYGNRASFTVEINGNGGLVSISEMGFYGNSSDPGDLLGAGFSWPNDSIVPGDWTYDATDIGIIDNPGGSYTYVTSGPATQLVNEIISIGAGNAYPSYLGDDPNPGATDQQTLDYDLAQTPASYDFTGTFTYGDSLSGSATFDFIPTVPDAGSVAFDALVLAGVAFSGMKLGKVYRGKKPAGA